MRCLPKCLLATLCIASSVGVSWSAQEQQSLEQASNDPTASILSVTVANQYSGDYHVLNDETGNTVQFRLTYPFKIGDNNHILRATVPVITNSPSGQSGLSDTTIFDLVTFNEPWGRWGFGAVALLPTASDDALGADKWAVGPAAGFVARESKLLWGLFNQNVFTIAGDDKRADVNVSIIQPILNYSLPNKWSVGASEMNFVYDHERNDWTALPIGMKLGKLARFGNHPITINLTGEYNFQDNSAAPKWTTNLSFKMLFPL